MPDPTTPTISLPFAKPLAIAPAKPYTRCQIRWMIRRDMPEVLAIEAASHAFPWCEEEDFLKLLRQNSFIGMVACHGEAVVGFFVYELHKSKLEILDFAVDPEFRRSTVGSQMVAKLVGKLSAHRRVKIALEVRESALGSLLFFRSQGFVATKTLREHYQDSGEDAYRLEYLLREDDPEKTNVLYISQDDDSLGDQNAPEECP